MKKNRKIGKFVRTGRKASSYKSLDSRIYAFYKKNKKLIDETLTGPNKFSSPYQKFKSKLKTYMTVDNLRFDEAVRAYSNSRVFTSKTEHGLINIMKSLKKDESVQLRKLLGYKKKIDWEGFIWNNEKKMYVDKTNTVGLVYNYTDDSLHESIISVVRL